MRASLALVVLLAAAAHATNFPPFGTLWGACNAHADCAGSCVKCGATRVENWEVPFPATQELLLAQVCVPLIPDGLGPDGSNCVECNGGVAGPFGNGAPRVKPGCTAFCNATADCGNCEVCAQKDVEETLSGLLDFPMIPETGMCEALCTRPNQVCDPTPTGVFTKGVCGVDGGVPVDTCTYANARAGLALGRQITIEPTIPEVGYPLNRTVLDRRPGIPDVCRFFACGACDAGTGQCDNFASPSPLGTPCLDRCDLGAAAEFVSLCDGAGTCDVLAPTLECDTGAGCSVDSCMVNASVVARTAADWECYLALTPPDAGCAFLRPGTGAYTAQTPMFQQKECIKDVTAAEGTPCADGDLCTVLDVCDAFGVCAGTPKNCTAFSVNQCVSDSACNPGTGSCDDVFHPLGFACDDGSACTNGTDECDGHGACVAGTPGDDLDCSFLVLDQCTAAAGCVDMMGVPTCVGIPESPDTPCDDGDPCTINDECVGFVCMGQPKDCSAAEPCEQDGTCNPGTGVCERPLQPFGFPCDADGDDCTAPDACNGVAADGCVAGPLNTCPPPNECLLSAGPCTPFTGCDFIPVPVGTPCNGTSGACGLGECLALCDLNCGAHGQCVGGACVCMDGYTGEDCSMIPDAMTTLNRNIDRAVSLFQLGQSIANFFLDVLFLFGIRGGDVGAEAESFFTDPLFNIDAFALEMEALFLVVVVYSIFCGACFSLRDNFGRGGIVLGDTDDAICESKLIDGLTSTQRNPGPAGRVAGLVTDALFEGAGALSDTDPGRKLKQAMRTAGDTTAGRLVTRAAGVVADVFTTGTPQTHSAVRRRRKHTEAVPEA